MNPTGQIRRAASWAVVLLVSASLSWADLPVPGFIPPPVQGPLKVVNDFNGDGKSDVLWRNTATGDNAVWLMNDFTRTSSALLPRVSNPDWKLIAARDFNGDRKADLLWRNTSSGDNAIWQMDGLTLASSALLPRVSNLDWTIAGTGDFDGDGKADILWRNTSAGDGNNAIWQMDGFSVTSTAYIPRVADTNWTIVGVGDFDGDAKADIVWRNTSTGDIAVWIMNGFTLVASAIVQAVPPEWTVAGIADYNGDRRADILWHNTSTGDNAIWLMNGLTRSSSALINAVPDATWKIVGTGDYNGDGKADILWRNTNSGDNAIWLMNGFDLAGSALIPSVSDPAWLPLSARSFTLTVTTAGAGIGTVSGTPTGSTYIAGTSVTLTATPNQGFFAGWSGACTGTVTTCTVTVNTNQSVTATFDLADADVPLSLVAARNFTGQYPTPGYVTYTSKNGQNLTALAYPGQVFVAVSPSQMNLAATLQLVQMNGGSLLAQIPAAGLYWAQVAIGSEAAFINGVKSSPGVIYVAPHVPLTTAQTTSAMVDLSGASSLTPLIPGNNLIAQFDFFRTTPRNNVCGFSHGAIVDQFLEQGGQRATTYDVTQIDRNTNQVALDLELFALAAGSDVGFGTLRAAEGALRQGQKLIVNVSLQSGGQPNDGRDRTVCETDPANALCFGPHGRTYASWKSDQFAFLVGVASGLQYMRDDLRHNTLVVVSAGNSGLNLTRELALLREFMPRAFSHMLVVGSLGANGQQFAGHNYANASDIIYAPGVDVAAPITAACSPSGTSFAAPQIANLAAQIAQRFPGATTAQIVAAIQTAAPRVNGLLTMPTLAQVANVLAPTYTLSISNTGTGNGAVSAKPSAATYSAGSIVTLDATPAIGSTFAGWGGACSGTGSCVLTMDANKTVTATFNQTNFDVKIFYTSSSTGTGTFVVTPAGTSCGGGCKTYPAGTRVTVTMTPDSGSTFAGWGAGACSGAGTNPTCTFTVTGNLDVFVTFTKTTGGGGGSVTGTWAGNWTRPVSGLCDFETSALTWNLTQSGNSVSGTFTRRVSAVDPFGLCPNPVGFTDSGTLVNGTLSGSSLTLFTGGGTRFDGTVSGTTISGTGGSALGTGPFSLTKQ